MECQTQQSLLVSQIVYLRSNIQKNLGRFYRIRVLENQNAPCLFDDKQSTGSIARVLQVHRPNKRQGRKGLHNFIRGRRDGTRPTSAITAGAKSN